MKTIEYAPDGLAIADVEAENKVREFLKSDESYIKVSTDNFILAARVQVHENRFSHKEVEFLFRGEVICPDADGRLPKWPQGFCDTTELFLARLLSRPTPLNPL